MILALLLTASPPIWTRYPLNRGPVCSALTAAPIQLCDALASGDKSGGWWCLRGDGTVSAGSVFPDGGTASFIYVNDGGATPTASWPVFPDGTLETMTRMNDTATTGARWDYYTMFNDGGKVPSPTGNFTICAATAPYGPVPATQVPTGSLVSFGDAGVASFAEIQQGAVASGATMIATGPGNSPANSVIVPIRAQVFTCGVFTGGVGAKACTYVPGTGGVVCGAATATALTKITASNWTWNIGVGGSGQGPGTVNAFSGWFRGAFLTEKALSESDMTRLGKAILPIPAISFYRDSNKTCCNSSNQCNTIPSNVPCMNGTSVEVEANGKNALATTHQERLDLWSASTHTDGGVPVVTTDTTDSPFGLRSAETVVFGATVGMKNNPDGGSDDGGVIYHISDPCTLTGCSATNACTISASVYAMGDGNPVDICIQSAGLKLGCTQCTPSTSAWTRCSTPSVANVTANSPSVFVGNLSFLNGGTARVATTQVLTSASCEQVGTPTSFIRADGTVTNLRASEACNGACCP